MPPLDPEIVDACPGARERFTRVLAILMEGACRLRDQRAAEARARAATGTHPPGVPAARAQRLEWPALQNSTPPGDAHRGNRGDGPHDRPGRA